MDNFPIPQPLQPFMPLIVNIAYAILIFTAGWIAAKWLSALALRVLRRSSVDKVLSGFLSSLVQYLALAATIIVALEEIGVETTSLVALLASAGLAIGLALQGSLGHFAAGVMILFFRPFTLDERVTAGGQTGTVKDIGLFATTLLTPSNEKIIVPNGRITGGSIVNHTTMGTLRGNIEIGVAYGSDLSTVMEVMMTACKRVELVLEDPAPSVSFVGFGASSLDFVVRPWAKLSDFGVMLQGVRIALYEELNRAGIDIPFDQIVVHRAS